MKNKKSWTLFFCLIVVIMVWMVGCSKEESTTPPSEEPAQQEDEEALEGTATTLGSLKSFSAESLEGDAFSEEDIQGKDVTIINFWALTCPPCIAEMPELAALEKALPENVQLITVCLDGAGDKESTKSILEDAGFEGVTLITGDGDLGALCGNIRYTPTTVLVNGEGNLVGDAIIGGQEALAESYLLAVNTALKAEGKAEISLEE